MFGDMQLGLLTYETFTFTSYGRLLVQSEYQWQYEWTVADGTKSLTIRSKYVKNDAEIFYITWEFL